jgi:predicted glycosyltransferase
MVTMGGNSWDFTFLQQLIRQPDYYFIIATNGSTLEQRDNLLLLPRHSTFFHPDLVNVSDAVIGKVGYSTLAEIYQAGVPYGYIPRPRFRESAVLSRFIADEMQGLAISPAQFQDGSWLARLPELLALPRLSQPDLTNGADQIARFVQERLSRL